MRKATKKKPAGRTAKKATRKTTRKATGRKTTRKKTTGPQNYHPQGGSPQGRQAVDQGRGVKAADHVQDQDHPGDR